MKNIHFRVAAILSVISVWTWAGYGQQQNVSIQTIGTRDINPGLNLFVPDLDTELSMGRRVAAELELRTTLIEDANVTGYVREIAQAIVRNSDARSPFTVKVIDSDSVNAMALPGGWLYLTKGLILAAESEAELAGLFAHLVAHITARHAMEHEGKAALVTIANSPASIFGVGLGIPVAVVQEALAMGTPIGFVAFGRAAEREADFLGLQYMVKAGYDPAAMLRFFERLQTQEIRLKMSPIFTTHPLSAERVGLAERHISNLAQATSEFDSIRNRLRENFR